MSFLPSPSQMMNATTPRCPRTTPPMPPRVHTSQPRQGPGCLLCEEPVTKAQGPRPPTSATHLGPPNNIWNPALQRRHRRRSAAVGSGFHHPFVLPETTSTPDTPTNPLGWRLPRGGPCPWTLKGPARGPAHLRCKCPRPFHHMAEPGLCRAQASTAATAAIGQRPGRAHRRAPEDFALASTHAVLLPCRPALVMHPGNRWAPGMLRPNRASIPSGAPPHADGWKPPPIWNKDQTPGRKPRPQESTWPQSNPISTTSQRKKIIRKAAESDRVDKRSTWLGLREKRPTFAALERRGCGEIGRHARLRIWCFGVGVRVPPPTHFPKP